ncbi:MAG: poly-gamma-glutamate biosynthesis protein PgsC, partial [Myxococcales bacterium]|nr:poly-gamma-glutamate biosynthesis protein PgsC [Myxococcales bacterium]
MSEPEILVVAIGLVVSLLFTEVLGIAPGGIIVPGYLALHMQEPVKILVTFLVAYLTYFIVTVLATVTIVYGRRRTVLMILVAFLLGTLVRIGFDQSPLIAPFEIDVIGYIVPGLIAIWLD